MGVPTKGTTGVGRSPHMPGRGCFSSSGIDATPSAGDSAIIHAPREHKRQTGGVVIAKLSRSRRPSRKAKQQQHRHHQQQQQQQRALGPVLDSFFTDLATPQQQPDPSLQHTASLPRLGQPLHPQQHDIVMQRTSSYENNELNNTPTKGAAYPASLRNLIHNHSSTGHSASTEKFSQEEASRGAYNNGEGLDDGYVNDQEQQAIRRGLEDLLARPPPTFDYGSSSSTVPGNSSGSQYYSSDPPPLLLQGGDSAASSSLPELFLSRTAAAAGDNRVEERRCSSESMVGSTLKGTGGGGGQGRSKKPTRSQSGGHLRPAPCATVANNAGGTGATRVTFISRRGDGAAFAGGGGGGVGPTKKAPTTAVAGFFKGSDAVLLEQAFAFAERVSREEEAGGGQHSSNNNSVGRKEGRRPRRDGEGSGVDRQLHGSDKKGGRLRRTKSSGSSVVLESGGPSSGGVGAGRGGRVEVEDWVRGLAGGGSSLHGSLSQRQLNHHQQSSRSINNSDRDGGGGGAGGGGHQARGTNHNNNRRGNKLTVGLRKKQNNNNNSSTEGAGDEWRFDRRREKEGKKRATATVELVQQFETGAGVAALRAELEASQASMRRSTEAIEQVASQWHRQRSMFPSAARTSSER